MRDGSGFAPVGLDRERDPDFVVPPTELEAIEALIDVNMWLSAIADLLPNDAAERTFLGLDDGLAYSQRKDTDENGEATYANIHDVNEAVEIQRELNKASFAARTAKRMQAQKGTFAELARLAA